MSLMRWLTVALLALSSGCTLYHSRQAIGADALTTPRSDARFVTEEDAGLALLGLLVLSEPDHYAVLMERARRNNECARLTHAQLDYYTDHWLLVGFPIARLTAICEPRSADSGTETATETETDSETETDAETETDSETDSETETETETDSETETETETETDSETETDAGTGAGAGAGTGAEDPPPIQTAL